MMLTVFTPAYNRADTLPRLYESLVRQSCFDFEWLIVDDGSTDATGQVAASFSDAFFPIRVIRKENGGKHTAYNTALENAEGAYFFCVDSDDLLPADAVETIGKTVADLPADCGIAAYKQDLKGGSLSAPFPAGVSFCKYGELYRVYGGAGEYSFIFPLEAARRFPFPVFEGEKFVTEGVVFERLDAALRYALVPIALTVCEYQPDGYSADTDKLMRNNPGGYCLYFLEQIDRAPSLSSRLVSAGRYHCFRRFAGKNASRYDGAHRISAALARPLGLLFRLYYKLVRKF